MSDEDKSGSNFISSAVFGFIVIGALVFFWPSLIAPFRFFEFWTIKGSLWEATKTAWPLYLWGIGVTAISLLIKKDELRGENPIEIFLGGTVISLAAGVLEEMAFRWLIFFSAIVMIPVMDWLLLGFMGLHWIKWIYVVVLCPVANFFTLGYLEHYLLNGYGWAVAAAIISANSDFRDGHRYLGPLGYVNSWFLGMYFFWVVFNHGLIAAMTIHFLYDFFIFCTVAFGASLVGRRRWA